VCVCVCVILVGCQWSVSTKDKYTSDAWLTVDARFAQRCQWMRSWVQGRTGLCKRIAWRTTEMWWFMDVGSICVCMGWWRDGMLLGSVAWCEQHSLLYIFNGNKINTFKLYMRFYTNKHSVFISSTLEVTWINFWVVCFPSIHVLWLRVHTLHYFLQLSKLTGPKKTPVQREVGITPSIGPTEPW
jgi:hypothetical protein